MIDNAMARISIQFHALPYELLQLVTQVQTDFPLYIVAMRFFPFDIIKVEPNILERIFADESPYEELAFTLHEPIISVKSNTEFAEKNPDKLRLDIRRPNDKGLRQTILSAHTNDNAALTVWKNIAKRLKAMTRAGVIVKNPNTGITGLNRTFRYTQGAKSLASSGMPMLPIGGGNLIEFIDVPG